MQPAEVTPEKKGMPAKEFQRRFRNKRAHELVPFLAIWAVQYQRDYGLNGLHPCHYDLLEKYGARMDSFTRATDSQN